MEKEENYSANSMPCNFSTGIDYTIDYHHQQQSHVGETSTNEENDGMVNYLLSNNQQQIQQQHHNFSTSSSFDKLSFADVMQFADFGPKLALNQTKIPNYEDSGMDSVCFLKLPVLNHDKFEDKSINNILTNPAVQDQDMIMRYREDDEARVSGNNNNNNNNPSSAHMQLQFLGDHEGGFHKTNPNTISEPTKNNTKRKRPRSVKTTEEVESQRMTHIAVERNRRKQMNEHLRVLRSLMPGSYVQRGDQASIIGGAIEFVRELEQLLQCLESQKRRRLVGDQESRVIQIGGTTDSANNNIAVVPAGIVQPDHHQPIVPYFPGATLPLPPDQIKFVDFETGIREETAENKSCLADVEVKLLGFDAIIKILSRRRPSQLIKTIAALEDLQFNILHTNITTIEQTVLYSFNVKVVGETRFNAEDIASSVQQIFSFIHANSTI